jgi:MFS family permease
MTQQPTGPEVHRETNWTGLGFGLSLAILAAYQQLKLPPVLPILIESYGFSRILAGGFVSVYALCGLMLSLRLGSIMQRRGTTALLNLAFLLFAGAAAFMMLWPELGWLFLGARAAEGVAFAILAIAGPAICTANGGTRGLAISSALIATWVPVGALIANMMTVGLVEWAGWRALWWVGIAATAAMALWTARVRRTRQVRLGGATTQYAAAALPARGNAPWRMLILGALLFTLWSVQMFAYFTWLPDYLVDIYGQTPRVAASLYMIPMAVLAAFNLVAVPVLRAGVPVAVLLAVAIGVQAAVWFLLPFLDPVSAGIAAFVVFAAAAGIAPTCLFALPGTIFGIDNAGSRAFGVLMTGRNLGVLCGPLLTGALVQLTGGWHLVPYALGTLGVAAAAGALALHVGLRRLRQP